MGHTRGKKVVKVSRERGASNGKFRTKEYAQTLEISNLSLKTTSSIIIRLKTILRNWFENTTSSLIAEGAGVSEELF